MKNLIVGLFIGITIVACGAMGKRLNYDEFARRTARNSVWMKCLDGDKQNVCKYICLEYTKKNKCKKKKEDVDRLDIQKALADGHVMMSPPVFLQLLMRRSN